MRGGVFRSDNWACGTIDALWKHMGDAQDICQDDERIRAFHCYLGDFFGFVTLQRYKWRGRVQGAIVFNTSAGGVHPLTLQLAEKALLE
jgi:hypothetical protein